jgi:hypothetical protein
MRLFFHLPENKSAKACQAFLWLHVLSRDIEQPTVWIETDCCLHAGKKMRSR